MNKKILSVLIASAIGVVGCNDSNKEASVSAKLRIVETSDLHANIMDFDYYKGTEDKTIGLSRTANLLKEARGEVTNTVLVDNGDLLQGSPMGDYIASEYKNNNKFDTHPAYKAMNLLDYAVGNIGNHEFNYGLEFLEDAINGADFPYINSNVYCKANCFAGKSAGDNLFTPYLIKETAIIDDNGNEQTIKIGYIGFVPPQILQWDKQNLDGNVTVEGIRESAEKFVPEMKANGADIIIAIPHSGIGTATNPTDVDKENASYVLTLVDGIDAIMFGHSHSVFPSATFSGDQYKDVNLDLDKGLINGVPAVMPGRWGDNLGVVDLNLTLEDGKWSVASGQTEARQIYKTVDGKKVAVVDASTAIHDAVATEHAETLAFVDAPIGKSKAAVDMYSFLSLVQDDPTVQIVSDAQISYVQAKVDALGSDPDGLQGLPVLSASAPFKAGGRHSAASDSDSYVQVAAGDLTYKNAADLYLYPNTVVALKVTGAELKDWLECSANQFNQIDPSISTPQSLINWDTHRTYNYDVIDGVTYNIDVTQPNKFDGDCVEVNASAERIKDLTYTPASGPALTGAAFLAQQFVVATNNYRAFGGKFAGTGASNVVLELPDTNRDALSTYITAESDTNSDGNYDSEVDPSADNNWSFTTITPSTTLDVRFETQDTPLADAFIGNPANQQRTMAKQGTDNLGFAIYTIDLTQ